VTEARLARAAVERISRRSSRHMDITSVPKPKKASVGKVEATGVMEAASGAGVREAKWRFDRIRERTRFVVVGMEGSRG
jgi:hypothetical protein